MKCKVETAAGKCSACPTSGATAGGSRKLVAASESCATVRPAADGLTTANGGANVELYGSHTTESAYAVPADTAAMKALLGTPAATHFICKSGYTTVFGANLANSKCVANASAVTLGATNAAVSPYDTPATTTEGSVVEMSQYCAQPMVKTVTGATNDLWACFACAQGKVLATGANATAAVACAASVTGFTGTECRVATSSAAAPAQADTVCKWCATTHVLKST